MESNINSAIKYIEKIISSDKEYAKDISKRIQSNIKQTENLKDSNIQKSIMMVGLSSLKTILRNTEDKIAEMEKIIEKLNTKT